MNFDWQDLVFASKKPINSLHATFIAAPREISTNRFTQIIQTYLAKGNLVLGLAKEPYVDGFADQIQFKTLSLEIVNDIIRKVNKSSSKHKIYTLTYAQRDLKYLLDKLNFNKVLLVNGSWRYAFHNSPAFYVLAQKCEQFEYISAFTDEKEARDYEKSHTQNLSFAAGPFAEEEMLEFANAVAELSYDYTYQTGAILGKKIRNKYTYLMHGFNKVLPYQTYAMLRGSDRERNFSPPNDLNHYDTIHAEALILTEALKRAISLKGATLFINLLPCPNCARMLAQTEIAEIIYRVDHSDGYANRLLELCGKKVKRAV